MTGLLGWRWAGNLNRQVGEKELLVRQVAIPFLLALGSNFPPSLGGRGPPHLFLPFYSVQWQQEGFRLAYGDGGGKWGGGTQVEGLEKQPCSLLPTQFSREVRPEG